MQESTKANASDALMAVMSTQCRRGKSKRYRRHVKSSKPGILIVGRKHGTIEITETSRDMGRTRSVWPLMQLASENKA